MIDKFLTLLGNLLTAGDLLYKAYDALKDWFKTKGWRNQYALPKESKERPKG